MARTKQLNTTVAGHPTVWESEKALKKYYKALTTEQVEKWVEALGLTFKPCPESEAIHRMRACMAILYHFFPRQEKPKKESKYKQYSTEQLLDMAINNDVVFEPCEDPRILRMRAIMALRAAKVID